MKHGQRIRVTASWSSFHGRVGRVVPSPDGTRNIFAVLDGDEALQPMRFGETEVTPIAAESGHVVCGE